MSKLREVAIVSACRTPIGAFGGVFKDVQGVHLASRVMKEAIDRSKIDPKLLGDVRYGCCLAHHDAMNVSRVASLLAGVPVTIPGVTMNRVCTSAMEAIHSSVLQIQCGHTDAVLTGGVESMSNSPYVVANARWGQRLQDDKLIDAMIHGLMVGSTILPYPKNGPISFMRGKPYIMGLTAEFLAAKHKISREEQDAVALRSHNNVERCTKENLYANEICPVEITKKKNLVSVTVDEHFRPGLKMDNLVSLPPAFIPNIGTVTAGNSSGINDGACALVLVALDFALKHGLKPLAIISGMGKGACAPELMGESPIPAVKDLLKRTGHKIGDYGRVECNEAFAVQYIACERGLGLNRDITNVKGSGIGLGHPVGCTGARIVVTLLHEMIESKTKLGLATLCGGGGVALATELTLC